MAILYCPLDHHLMLCYSYSFPCFDIQNSYTHGCSITEKSIQADPLSMSRITRLRSRHSDLICDITQLLSEKKLPCNEMVAHITSLPPKQVGEHFHFVIPHMMDTTVYPNIYQLMQKLSTYMQFLDFRLLRELILHFSRDFRPGLLKKMETYEGDVLDFCQNTAISTLSSIWQGEGVKVPEYFTTLQAKHNLDRTNSTLQDLKELQRNLGKKLGCCLKSQLNECAMILFKVELKGSFVTWLIPMEIIPDLMAAMMKTDVRKFFISVGIVSVFIEGKLTYRQDQTSSQESDSESEDDTGENLTSTPKRKSSGAPPESKSS